MHNINKLSNGVRVVTQSMPDSGSVAVNFFIGAGGRYEDHTQEHGAAHFIEHLLFKGTTKRPSAKIIAEEIDGVGGYMNAYTSSDHTSYYIKLPKEHFELAAEILSDILTDPLFDQAEIDRERLVVIEEMKVYRDDPARHIYDLIGGLLWPQNALCSNVLGDEQSISSMGRQTILDYFAALYTADNLVVSVAGNISEAKVLATIQKLLGSLKTKATRSYSHKLGDLSSSFSNVVQQDTNQTHLVVTGRGPSLAAGDEPAMRVLGTILGGGPSSRLHLSVREQMGLAYSIAMGVDTFLDTGDFEIYAGVSPENTTATLKAIKQELHKIQTHKVDAVELNKVKQQMRGRLIMGLESNAAVADMLGGQLIVSNRTWSLEDILAKIDHVTQADVQDAANKYLAADGIRLAMIGPHNEAEVSQFEAIIKE
ncbi:insulinase family protein [Candidatus Saccharibacteria bacterium]|nr:insulinase family protein [Candidatus Saccharibacteria bacterium]